jgi:hypothetical protein
MAADDKLDVKEKATTLSIDSAATTIQQ